MKVGDLITYADGAWGLRSADRCLGIVTAVNVTRLNETHLAGHCVVLWIKHENFQGQEKVYHPANLKLFKKKS